jgi:OOP family OmpA-OmpF porin
MASHVKPQAKIVLVMVAVVVLVFVLRILASHGIIPTPGILKSVIPPKVVLPDVKDAQVSNVVPAELPQTSVASVSTTLIRGDVWEWNAEMGLNFANGGPNTTVGSLMAKRNVNLSLNRQDVTDKMKEDIVACAKEIHDGAAQCSTGANFVVIMGGGAGQFAASVNPLLAKLGPQYLVKVIGSVGYSRGEDAFLAPPEVKKNPANARGLLVEGVILDDDWHIALKYAGDNGIPNNPDEHTYDPDAINWVNAPDYNTAAADYVAGKCEDRRVVKDGHPTGETRKVCVNGIVTWTPGDVTAVTQRGGLVKIVSTKQYLMPAVILGPGKFFADNREEISNMLAAAFEGGDQIKAFDQSLRKAALISRDIYNDEGDKDSHNGEFWYRYYKGATQKDSQGLVVDLGGSAVSNLDDDMLLFGLKRGTNDNFRAVYTVFANIDRQQYPTKFKETPIPDVKDVEDKSYITSAEALLSNEGNLGSEAQQASYVQQASGRVISDRSYQIQFNTGSAELTPAGEAQLRELRDSLSITSMFIKVDGYTDNTGDERHTNLPLSQARAEAIRTYLQKAAPNDFPSNRFSVAGHGSQNPVADNSSAAGKAANRRVQISLLGK